MNEGDGLEGINNNNTEKTKGMTNTEVGEQLGIYVWDGICICTQVACSKNPVREKRKRSNVTIISPGQLDKVVQEGWQVSWQQLPWSCLANSAVSGSDDPRKCPVSSVFHQIRRD